MLQFLLVTILRLGVNGSRGSDDRIVHLLGVMTDVITFVDTVDALSIIQARREVVLFLIQQVTECGYFVTSYTQQKRFCELS